ncbi:hypothetical protein NQ314_002055 [Rhamnusium bicolor]|uniref:Uncharacterized protein n=1 Tax=Rhamnusium bicolor TaxID=1586634 RepID=A0AAV8ZSK6_9CUCU|nr:hypothetical protein NQ314_002055 [Rhamnusium bicolor]
MYKNFVYYHFCTAIILIFWLGVEINFRFKTLNKLLLKTVSGLKNDTMRSHEEKHNFCITDNKIRPTDVLKVESYHLKKIRLLHNDLRSAIEEYNQLFGINLLLFVLFDTSNTYPESYDYYFESYCFY